MPARFAQDQECPCADDGGGPEPAMRHQEPGGIGPASAGQAPADDSGDCRLATRTTRPRVVRATPRAGVEM
jgi:hypothetical protein